MRKANEHLIRDPPTQVVELHYAYDHAALDITSSPSDDDVRTTNLLTLPLLTTDLYINYTGHCHYLSIAHHS